VDQHEITAARRPTPSSTMARIGQSRAVQVAALVAVAAGCSAPSADSGTDAKARTTRAASPWGKPEVLFAATPRTKLDPDQWKNYGRVPSTNHEGWYDPHEPHADGSTGALVFPARVEPGCTPPEYVEALTCHVGSVAYMKRSFTTGRISVTAAFSSKTFAKPVLMAWPNNDEWPSGVEYDFFEGDDGKYSGNLNYAGPGGSKQTLEANHVDIDITKPHTYTLELTPERVRYLVDGKPVLDTTQPAALPKSPHRLTPQVDFATTHPGSDSRTQQADMMTISKVVFESYHAPEIDRGAGVEH